MSRSFTPKDVLELTAPTKEFLCPLGKNSYDIEFLHFSIADTESKRAIFDLGKRGSCNAVSHSSYSTDASYRTIRYEFSEDVLRLPSITTKLEFSVGDKEVQSLRMIERHYFKDEIIKSFDFTFGYCIPGSVNNWEAIYSVPPMDEGLLRDIIDHPYATVSDSFYFAGNEMIMHNKAQYKYISEDRAQSKRTYDMTDHVQNKHASCCYKQAEAKDAKRGAKECVKWSKEDDYE